MALQLQTFCATDMALQLNNKIMSSGLDMSTWEGDGDSSSESCSRSQYGLALPATYSGQTPTNFRGRSAEQGRSTPAGSAEELAVNDDENDDYNEFSADHSAMPSTREPSPEPLWNQANQYGMEYVPSHKQVFMIPRDFPQVPNVHAGTMMTMPNYQPHVAYNRLEQPRQSMTPPSGHMIVPTTLPSAPTEPNRPKTNSKKQEEVPRSKSSKDKGKESKKQKNKARGEASVKVNGITNMSEENKAALTKYIYEFMVKSRFTSPDGYLLVDVLEELWKEMGDGSSGGRIAQYRFAELLRAAPQYFELFRKGIRVTNHCGWFARKGEKMVRLVPQTSA
jgi:hypothetical protein